jgi:hypothetical protein
MALDPDRTRFKGKLIAAAIRKGGSVEDAQAGPFIDKLLEEWRRSGATLEESARWLDERLKDVFLSLNGPPKWVEEEPAWPFLDGIPMVFLSQTQMDNSSVSVAALSPGETVYLFAARQPVGNGFKMQYRTVSQFEE